MQEPTERTARRAAQIWRKFISNPAFDNGANDPQNIMAQGLASMLVQPVTEEQLDKFEDALVNRIMSKDEWGCYRTRLCVDYHPCQELAESAEEAGISPNNFPWKTNMTVYGDTVCYSPGYGAEWIYDYALPDGRWLVTSLSGSDIEKIKDHIVSGTPLHFQVED